MRTGLTPVMGRAAMPWNRVLAAGGVAGLAALAERYAAGLARADRSWPVQVEARLSGLGEVDEVSILPLVERLTPGGSGLTGEPGVSYLIRAGGMRVPALLPTAQIRAHGSVRWDASTHPPSSRPRLGLAARSVTSPSMFCRVARSASGYSARWNCDVSIEQGLL
jgi:hypothetical protein